MEARHVNPPFFTIVIPCYNDGVWAISAVKSCLAQQVSVDYEILLVDDGSTDDSVHRLDIFFRGVAKLRILRKSNGGLSSARNFGAKYAKANWIVFLDADDTIEPNFLEAANRALQISQNKRRDLIFCGYRYISSSGLADARVWATHLRIAPRFGQFKLWNRFLIRLGNVMPVSSVIVSAELARCLNGFDEDLAAHEDWDFWIRAIDAGASIQYAPRLPNSRTAIALREGMSSNKDLMKATWHQVHSRYSSTAVAQLLAFPIIRVPVLLIRAGLGGVSLIYRRCVGQ